MGSWDEEFQKVLIETVATKGTSKVTASTPSTVKSALSVSTGSSKSSGASGGSAGSYMQNKANVSNGVFGSLISPYGSYVSYNPVLDEVTSRMTVGNKKKKEEEEKKLDFFQKGAFEDGYQFGDLTKTILGVGTEEKGVHEYWDSVPGLTLDELKVKMDTEKDIGKQTEYTKYFNDKMLAEYAKVFANTTMDGQEHSVLDEIDILSKMESGKEKDKRKAAVLTKMEELGMPKEYYALFAGDGEFDFKTFGKFIGNAAAAGLNSFNKSLADTADLLLGAPLREMGWENNPFTKLADYYNDNYNAYAYNRDMYAKQLGGGAWDFAGSAVEGTVGAVPHALLAFMTGGTSLGASKMSAGSELATKAALETGNVLTKAGLTAEKMLKNPQFWTSFASTLGTDYQEAKAKGASDEVAAIGSVLSSMLNAGIEIGFDGGSGIQGLPSDLAEGGSKFWSWFESAAEEAGEEDLQKFVNEAFGKILYRSDEEILNPIDYAREGTLGFIAGGALGGGQVLANSAANAFANQNAKNPTQNETAVIEKLVADEIAKRENNGKKVSAREKSNIKADIIRDIEKGRISTDTIEEVLGGEAYDKYKAALANQNDNDFLNSYEELSKKTNPTTEDVLTLSEMKPKYKAINDYRTQTKAELSSKVSEFVRNDRLAESYRESDRRKQKFEADVTKYDEKQREIVQKAIDSGVLNNTNRSHEFVDVVAKISADKGVPFDFTNNAKLKEAGFAVEGATVDGFVNENGITINMQSPKAWQTTVGHEVSHVLEGTEFYSELQNVLFEYAKRKGDYKARYDALAERYKEVYKDISPEEYEAKINDEVTSDLIGEYLFTDEDFVNNLTANKNVFQKIYDEIKYLAKIVTAGSKEARDIERIKKAFDKAYKEAAWEKTDMKYSISEIPMEERLSGDALLDAEDLIYDIEEVAEISPNGYVTVYHRTTEENAKKIMESGKMSAKEDGIFFSTQKEGAYSTDYGKGVVELKVPVEMLVLDDIFDTEAHLKIPLKNRNEVLDISDYLPGQDTKYSLSVDSDGRKLSEGQEKFFQDSQARTDEGNLALVYHTSPTAGFTVFEGSKGEGNYKYGEYGGGVTFFTDNKQMSSSYGPSDEKVDTTKFTTVGDAQEWLNDVSAGYVEIRSSDGVYKVIDSDGGSEILSYQSEDKLLRNLMRDLKAEMGIENEPGQYEGYVNIKNPYVIDADNREWNNIEQEFSQEIFDSYKSLTDEEKSALTDLANKAHYFGTFKTLVERVLTATDTSERSTSNIASGAKKLVEKDGTINAENLFYAATREFDYASLMYAANVRLTTNDIVERALKDGSYDGVIIKNVWDYGGYVNDIKKTSSAGNLYIVFNSNQFKAADNLKPTDDPDIRYSLTDKNVAPVSGSYATPASDLMYAPVAENSTVEQETQLPEENSTVSETENIAPTMDNEGNPLSDGLQKDLEKSQCRDTSGKLIKVKHGTMNAGFSSFADGKPIYFTDNSLMASSYMNPNSKKAGVKEGYLDIQKPYIIDAKGKPWNDIRYLPDSAKPVLQQIQSFLDSLSDAEKKALAEFFPEGKNKIGSRRELLNLIEKRYDRNPYHQDLSARVTGVDNPLSYSALDKMMSVGEIYSSLNGVDIYDNKRFKYTDTYVVDIIRNGFSTEAIEETLLPIGLNSDGLRAETNNLVSAVKKIGKYDGVIFKNVYDYGVASFVKDKTPGNVYVVFSPEQFKTENSTVEQETQLSEENSTVSKMEKFAPSVPTSTAEQEVAATSEPKTTAEKAQDHYRDDILNRGDILSKLVNSGKTTMKAVTDATKQAQTLISKGADGVKSIDDIFGRISTDGKLGDFEDYLHHLLNVDRRTMNDRFGLRDRPVWDFSAEESQKRADKLAEENPEFVKAAEDVYAFNDYVMRVRVQSGKITQEQADIWKQYYPHYVPISRGGADAYQTLLKFAEGDTTAIKTIDDFANEADLAADVHRIKRQGEDFDALMDTMVNAAFTAHWGLAISDNGVTAPVQTQTSVDAPVADTAVETQTEEDYVPSAEKAPSPDAVQPADHESIKLMEQHDGVRGKLDDAVHWVEDNVLDNGRVFEKIDHKKGNRNLYSHWHAIRNAFSSAQHFIGNGNSTKGVRALNDIYAEINKKGLTSDFDSYLAHQRNIDGMTMQARYGVAANRDFVKGVSAAQSYKEVQKLQTEHPEFKQWADDIYANTGYVIDQMVEHKMLSQDMADLFKELYPHYVPMRYGKNGALESSLESLGQFTMEAFNSFAMNDFGLQLKHTLRSEINREDMNIDTFIDRLDSGTSLFDFDVNGMDEDYHTFTVYEDGELKTFDITREMYMAMNQTRNWMDWKIPVLYQVNEGFRKATTELNWIFAATNGIKDPQEILWNSQHPLETYAKFLPAEAAVWSKDSKYRNYYEEYLANGGESVEYFNPNNNKFDADKGVFAYLNQKIGTGAISKLNGRVETAPRLAEYIASREAGKSVQESMLDAAQVTVNFQAGGKLTKFLNRNGCTFLNASVQGALQHVRNIQEGKQNAWKGVSALIAKGMVAGLGSELVKQINHLLWGDDDEYENLPDYIKQDYYLFGKFGDGTWLRLPKGRTNATVEEAIRQVALSSTGDDESDWDNFWKLFIENMAPNNPITNNLLAPILEVKSNTTWYGEDLVPSRLLFSKDENGNEIEIPEAKQFDEKTDDFSVWLGEQLDYSPKKINYLLNSYTGVIGDTFLPMMTPKAESPDDSLLGQLVAPLRDKFTTDAVLNHRATEDFYDTLEKAELKAESEDATQQDKFESGMLIGYNAELSKLYAKQREIQMNKSLKNSEKYEQTREIKKEINALQEKALQALEDYSLEGKYAEAGEKRYNFDAEDNRWYEIKPKNDDGTDNWYYQQEQRITKDLGISSREYWNNRKMYDDFYYIAGGYEKDDPEDDRIETARAVFGYEEFAKYAADLKEIKADKDAEGNIITSSKWPKVQAYVNSLDVPDIEKKILYTIQYPNYKKYKKEIVKYLDENDDISYESFYKILDELKYKVDNNGRVTWW
jgi:hypothetical protein